MSEQQGNMTVTVGSGDTLHVRRFSVTQTMSSLYTVTITAVCDNADVDLEAVVGQEASFTLHGRGGGGARTWHGVCSEFHQIAVEERGVSTYHFCIVPKLWLASQRRNYRIFQLKTELDIAAQLLDEWRVAYDKHIQGVYKSRKYRVQYGESDFAFFSRMLEEAGISFYFEEKDGDTVCVLSDAPQANATRVPSIAFRDAPTVADKEHVTDVRVSRQIRPGKLTLRDVDYRRPASFKLMAGASGGLGVEEQLESFHYEPGAFLFESDRGEGTPVADDKAKHRTDEVEGEKLAGKRLAATRGDAGVVTFRTNVIDLAPGVVMSILDHPQREVAEGKRLLVVNSYLEGRLDEDFLHRCELRSAAAAYHPPLVTPKPKVNGVESATVVGPAGEEIHTDEFGRVRVHFHWDRESKMDDNSSCWIPSSQPWGGTGYGGSNLPRVGQEVIVDFLGGDPDRPVVVGRVYTNLQKTPYKLPDNKTQSGWKTNSTDSTGGYNELMFEDKAGSELLRMQAERDLHKLVKHDENIEVRNDRAKKIVHDEVVEIGNDRTKTVGNNETYHVVQNRVRTVGADENVTIGGNRTKLIEQDETVTVKKSHSSTIGQNLFQQVLGSVQQMFGVSATQFVGVNHSVTVGASSTKQVGMIDSTAVGQMKVVMIAPGGESLPAAGSTHYIMEDGKFTFDDGKGGSITIEGGKITLSGANGIEIKAAAGDVLIVGAPKIKLNP